MTRSDTLREQARILDEWLGARLATVVPRIMERCGIDCWVLVAGEYNEDPVVSTICLLYTSDAADEVSPV